jgi:hypothetical protein
MFQMQLKAAEKNSFSPPEGMSAPEVSYWGAVTHKPNEKEPSFIPLFENYFWASIVVDAAISKYISLTVRETKPGSGQYFYNMDSLKRTTGDGYFDKIYAALAYKCPIDTENKNYVKALKEIRLMPKDYLYTTAMHEKYLQMDNNMSMINGAISFLLLACSVAGAVVCNGLMSVLCFIMGFFAIVFFSIVHNDSKSVYNKSGRILKSQVNGFKAYLSASGAERLTFVNTPPLTFDLYEKYLPYAVGLGVNLAWYFTMQNELGNKTKIDPIIKFSGLKTVTVNNFPQEALHFIDYENTDISHSSGTHSKSHIHRSHDVILAGDVDDLDDGDDGDDGSYDDVSILDIIDTDDSSDYSSDDSSYDSSSDSGSYSSDTSSYDSSSDTSSYDSGSSSSDYGDDS